MSRSSLDHPESPRAGAVKLRSGDVLRAAVDLFAQASTHERSEIRAFADLLAGLLPDAGLADRRHVATVLAHRADTPPSVARLLAMDSAEIAGPVILRSPVLTSSDLVQIMRCGPDHVALVAERLDLAPDIAAALTRSTELESDMLRGRRRAASPQPDPRDEEPPLPVEDIVEWAVASKPIAESDVMAEVALQRALDELAAELEAETLAREAGVPEPDAIVPGNVEAEAFFAEDPAGRWRIIQDHATTVQLLPAPRRRKAADPAAIGARLFAALARDDHPMLVTELMQATELDRAVVDRILRDPFGEPLAVTLAALGVDERTATSILLLHAGETATLGHMQDLSAMAGRIGWRTADHILSTWRGAQGAARGEAVRVLDPADRRGSGRVESTGTGERGQTTETGRRRGNEG